jgi:CubicO group peptidase (beta-lactamase class C family)
MSDALTACLTRVVASGLTPGCAGAVVDERGVVAAACAGTLAPDDEVPGPHEVRPSTVYDLASLTKLLCTTWLAAQAVDDVLLELDELVDDVFDDGQRCWPGVTVAHLLWHASGLPAHRPFFRVLLDDAARSHDLGRAAGARAVLAAVRGTPLEAPAGARVVYSDLGFIALGAILEARLGAPLDVLNARLLARCAPSAAPAALRGLRFVRLAEEGMHPCTPLVAPTEQCPWRKRFVQGQVHDDNAFAIGGVAGHAGLFGALDDVTAAAIGLLSATLTSGQALARFALAHAGCAGPARALGFDVATPGGSTGDTLSARTVGHLGFTGTSLWLDLERRRAYVLLANTVHLGRDGIAARNKALRVAFHQAAAPLAR